MEAAAELAGPGSVPAEARYLWEWFAELNEARGGTGFGLSPISHAEIAAWAGLLRRRPTPWEIRTLRMMDAAFLRADVKKRPA